MVGTQPFICILVSLFGHFYPGERFLQSTYNGSLPDFIMLRHCHHAGTESGTTGLSIFSRSFQ